MDSALYKNQPEFGILIFPVPLKMLADSNSFLDQVIQILRDLRCKTMSFQNSENLASSNTFHLWNSVRVTKNDTNLRWGQTLLRKFADGLINLIQLSKQTSGPIKVNTLFSKKYQVS